MEYVYAALLLHKLKQEITEDNITKVVKSTGVTPNEIQVKALVAALGEVNIDEALKAAPVALSSSPAASAGPSTSAPSSADSKVEEEKKEEKKEEEALEGLSALFG